MKTKKNLKQVGGGPIGILLVYAALGTLVGTALFMVGNQVTVQNKDGTEENVDGNQSGGRSGWVKDGKDHYEYRVVKGDKGSEYALVFKYEEEE